MTRLLADVLHERADHTPVPTLDVDAIIGAGERRVRRGRLTTGLAAAAVAVAVVGTGFAVPGLLASPAPDVADVPNPFLERRVSWASGEVIHWGAETFPVGRPVASNVQTDDGFVFTTPNGDVWFHDGSSSRRIGHTGNGRLRADDAGSLVAWVGAAESGAPQYVVHDTGTGREVARVDDSAAGPSQEETDLGAEEEDDIRVYDVASGADVTPDLRRYPFAVAYGWVDVDTAMVLGIEELRGETFDVDLLSCDVPTGACAMTGESEVGELGLVLPVGDPMTERVDPMPRRVSFLAS